MIQNHKGFSFIELMAAIVILALGTTMIHETYLRSAELFERYENSIKIQNWMDEKLWDAKNHLLHSVSPEPGVQEGDTTWSGKSFHWSEEIRPIHEQDLYSIRLVVTSPEAHRLLRSEETYVFHQEIPQGQ